MTKTIGERVTRARELRGWKKADLARRTGLSKAFVGRLESNERAPDVANAVKIAKALGMTLDALILGR